ncbi:MAG: diguanylate cyclase [Candidatus Omnitrophota bacterium]
MPERERLSLSSRGLRYKLKIGFYLMSVLPLLISFYVISAYVLPVAGIKPNVFILIIISIFIAVIGFWLMRQMINPIINISARAQDIARGNIDYKIKIERDDEIGNLAQALNKLTLRIKGNMQELKRYGDQTREINLEINRKVVMFSGLLQISSFISQGANIDDTFNLVVEKVAQVGDSDLAFLLLREDKSRQLRMKAAYGLGSERLLNKIVNIDDDSLFSRIIREKKGFSLGKGTARNKAVDDLERELVISNAFILPITVRNKVIGLIGAANNRGSEYGPEDVKAMDIFSRQITIAVENDILSGRLKRLEIKDELTGLYNQSFIRARLDEEIKRAIVYQRPCSFVLFDFKRSGRGRRDNGGFSLPVSGLKDVSLIIRENITDIDRAGRFSENEFAIIFPEKNKRQALEASEEIKERIEYLLRQDKQDDINVRMAVAENPIDGATGPDLIDNAQGLIEAG